jgi:hypothetical protein
MTMRALLVFLGIAFVLAVNVQGAVSMQPSCVAAPKTMYE